MAGALVIYRGLRFVVNLVRDVLIPLGNLRKTLPGWKEMQVVPPLREVQNPSKNLFICFDWPRERHAPPGELVGIVTA